MDPTRQRRFAYSLMVLTVIVFTPFFFIILLQSLITGTNCGGRFTSSTGTIRSPNYPREYTNNLDCVFVITAPEGHRVILRFTTFSLESCSSLANDIVEIRDGGNKNSRLLDKYCGTLAPFTVASSGEQMYINFVTDPLLTRKGFRATYTTDSVQTSTTSNAATTSRTRITSTSMTAAPPSPTTTASTTITTSTTEYIVLATSKELPFDTDGSQELTLTCNFHKVSQVKEYGWSLTCERQTGNTCVFLPKPEDDGKLVTCTVTLVDGGLETGSLKMELNYPPQTTPVIIGYTKGEVLKAGDDLRVTCSVHGGKPLVRDVIFICDGHPDTAHDTTGQGEVHSVLQFTPVTADDDGKRCICTADWKDTDWYRLSVTTILTVNATQEGSNKEHGEGSVPVIAGAVCVIIIVIIAVVVVVFRRNGQRTYDISKKKTNGTRDPASPYPGLAPVGGQPCVVSHRSFDPIASVDDGTVDNNRSSLFAEIGEMSDYPFSAEPTTINQGQSQFL